MVPASPYVRPGPGPKLGDEELTGGTVLGLPAKCNCGVDGNSSDGAASDS